MSQYEKLRQKILAGSADGDVPFDAACNAVERIEGPDFG